MDKKSSATILKILMIVFSVLIIHLCIVYYFHPTSSAGMADNRTRLVIDTDAGGDDAVAILLALGAADWLRVVAISCVYGNTDEEKVETNVRKILTVAGRHDIPVYGGVRKPLLRNYTAGDYFGKDGLGDFEFGREVLGSVDRSKHAALAMIELANQHPGDISILTLGPLTNVALAASLDPGFTRKVKRFYVMGATVDEANNEATEAEFNFGLDPESDAIFLNSTMSSRAVVAPWDVVLKNKISKDWRNNVLGKLNSEPMRFLNKVESGVLEKLDAWFPADSVAVAVMLWPEIVTRSVSARMTVRTCGDRSGSVETSTDVEERKKNVDVVRDFDLEKFKDKLMRYLA